jgi:uncharacterized protein (TIGR02246 family)
MSIREGIIANNDTAGNVIEMHEHAGDFRWGLRSRLCPKTGRQSNNGFPSDAGPPILFKSRRVQFLETYNAMNWRKFVLLGCVVACVLAASTASAQTSVHSNSMSRTGMRGALPPRSIGRMPMQSAPMPGSMGRMPMQRSLMMNSALGLRRFNDWGFHRDHRFHHFNNFKEIIFISGFGLPWWSGWGPWCGWNWLYPYGAYEYSEYSYPSYYSGYGYGYGNYGYGYGWSGYGYGYYPSVSYYGSYYGTNDEKDDETAVRNVLAEYAVSWNSHDMAAFGHLFTDNCDYVNISGVHWTGVQEIIQRQAELFQNRLKSAVRRITGAEVRFPTRDVALVHATWDVTGWSRPTGEAVPVLKEITTIVMLKTNGKWLITAFQNTEGGGSTK